MNGPTNMTRSVGLLKPVNTKPSAKLRTKLLSLSHLRAVAMERVGGRTLPELYQDWTRLLSKMRDGLETLERFTFSSPPSDGGVDPTKLDGHIDAIPLRLDGLPLAVFRRQFRARSLGKVSTLFSLSLSHFY